MVSVNELAWRGSQHLSKDVWLSTKNYVAVSGFPNAGYGLFAGRDYVKGELVEINVTFTVKEVPKALEPYYFESMNPFEKGDSSVLGDSMLIFGLGSVMNHGGEGYHNVRQGYYVDRFTLFRAVCPIKKGDELLIDYGASYIYTWKGRESYGSDQQVPVINSTLHAGTSIPRQAWLSTKNYVAKSGLLDEGDGLFAGRDYEKGELVEVNLMFVVNKVPKALESYNFRSVDTLNNSDNTVLIYGLASLINHVSQPHHNVEQGYIVDRFALFRAARPIKAGDELLLSSKFLSNAEIV